MFSHLRKPDFERLRTTLMNGRADAVPLLELGIHPKIKAQILGRPITGVVDDIEFMQSMATISSSFSPSTSSRSSGRSGAPVHPHAMPAQATAHGPPSTKGSFNRGRTLKRTTGRGRKTSAIATSRKRRQIFPKA